MTIIERISNLLSQNQITVSKMMKDLGFSSGLFSQWKSGMQKPSNDKLLKIAEYFGVSTDYLLTGKEGASNNIVLDDDRLIEIYNSLDDGEKEEFIKLGQSIIAKRQKGKEQDLN